MKLEIPQIIWCTLTVLGLGYSLAKDGKPKTGQHDFIASVIASSLVFWLLYEGGFFK